MFEIWPDRDANLDILQQMSKKSGVIMCIQDELVNKGLSLDQTQEMQAVDDFARLDAERKRLAAAAKAEKARREQELREAEEAANHARIVGERESRKEQKKQDKQRQKVAKEMRIMESQAAERRCSKVKLDAEIRRQARNREQQLQEERIDRLRYERQGPSYYAPGCECAACRLWPPGPGYRHNPQGWYPR